MRSIRAALTAAALALVTITPVAGALGAQAAGTAGTAPAQAAAAVTTAATCTGETWSADTVYTGGATVTFDGHTWRAGWWTQGEQPGTTGEWGVWRDQGACVGTTPTDPSDPADPADPAACTADAWSATATYTGGTLVSHAEHTWSAKWWTQGEEPGASGGSGCGSTRAPAPAPPTRATRRPTPPRSRRRRPPPTRPHLPRPPTAPAAWSATSPSGASTAATTR
ncbi:carbohydrate-binding protein [Cellulomonas soli]